MRAAHPMKPQLVNTDERMLVMLSAEVKKHYTKISDYGKADDGFDSKPMYSWRQFIMLYKTLKCTLIMLKLAGKCFTRSPFKLRLQ